MFSEETKTYFKQKIIDSVVGAAVYGLGIVILWAIYVSISGERQMKETSEILNAQMVNFYNEGVKRDKELNNQLETHAERMGSIENLLKILVERAPANAAPSDTVQPPVAPPRSEPAPRRPQEDYYEQHARPYTPLPQQQRMIPQNNR